jgi:hypothetical protein
VLDEGASGVFARMEDTMKEQMRMILRGMV